MYPFVTLGLLWIAAPFAAYSIQNQKITFLKMLLIWSACLLLWYLGMAELGYQAIGEEGDYNGWTVVWWLLNFFIFQNPIMKSNLQIWRWFRLMENL